MFLCNMAFPVFAVNIDDDAGTLYNQQLKKPGEKLNTGVTYWLELRRNGKRSEVSNRTRFRSGDGLRFHCKPNFNGYAYILMLEASQGGHYILFPTKQFPKNRFQAGAEISLPSGNQGNRAWLKFDKAPGTETLRVILSRTPLNAKEHFCDNSDVTIAAKNSDDRIPQGTLVSEEPEVDNGGEKRSHKLLQGRVTVVGRDPEKLLTVDVVLDHAK
ncbi:MAG TPA: DUF4384 domain-containing protein [Oculatellaceae cyanobacterium]